MQRADIVVLNDMHPDEFPGAASIAYSHAQHLSMTFRVSFWHTTLNSSAVTKDALLEIRSFHRNGFFEALIRKYMATRLISEFTSLIMLLKLTVNFARKRPKLVWINQIGNRIPRTVSLVLFFLRIKVVQTFHDFSVISPRKLYPQNVTKLGRITLSGKMGVNALYAIRRFLLKSLVNWNYQNVCISEIQSDIYKSIGVRNTTIIPNGIKTCDCSKNTSSFTKENKVLFAGRSTGKGFTRICRIIKNNPNWTLMAAGEKDLEVTAKEFLSSSQFEYLGFLSPSILFSFIHRVKFVSVLSECFDVYPTIALEGLAHNSRVLTTQTTGVAKFLMIHGGGVLLDSSSTLLNLDDLYSTCLEKSSQVNSLIAIDTSVQMYASIFLSAKVPTIY